MDKELKVLVRNAKVQLEVEVDDLHHFRPRRGEDGNECAIIQLSPTEKGPYFAKIYDEREDSVIISRGMANIRTAEKVARTLLDKDKVKKAKDEAHDSWPEFLALNASVYLDYEETNSGRKQPVLILRDPEGSEEDGLLTAIAFDKGPNSSFAIRDSRDSWLRMVLDRNKEERDSHFLLVTVTSKESPIVVFHRSIDENYLVATDYILGNTRRIVRRQATIIKEIWLEGEPSPEVIASVEEEVLEEPIEVEKISGEEEATTATPQVGHNGKTAVECPECGTNSRIGSKKVGTTKCKTCDEVLQPVKA